VVHLGILLGGVLAPEHFLFPLGLVYMVFGATRALVLGLMERAETEVPGPLPESVESDDADLAERRRPWGERRQGPTP